MLMPGRSYQPEDYRFGFNGQEKDDEINGSGNLNTAMYWEYDTRLGRRWNLDPNPNPSISNYAVFANNPIWFSDPLGDTVKVDNKGGILSNDKKDNLVYMLDKGKFSSIGELGKKIDANTIYANAGEENAKEAKGIYNPFTFKKNVQNKGKWDLKNNKNTIYGLANDGKTKFDFQGKEMESQDIGNHHFGVVGKAYGLFSEDFMLRQAGEAQIGAGTSKPEWQPVIKTTTDTYIEHGMKVKTTEIIKLPPYGDDPRDQEWIKAGFKYYKNIK